MLRIQFKVSKWVLFPLTEKEKDGGGRDLKITGWISKRFKLKEIITTTIS